MRYKGVKPYSQWTARDIVLYMSIIFVFISVVTIYTFHKKSVYRNCVQEEENKRIEAKKQTSGIRKVGNIYKVGEHWEKANNTNEKEINDVERARLIESIPFEDAVDICVKKSY